jgi:hypothetical protein
MKPGLYANIHAKRKRIKAGSKEKMRKVGSLCQDDRNEEKINLCKNCKRSK